MNYNLKRDLEGFATHLVNLMPVQITRLINTDYSVLQDWLAHRLSGKNVNVVQMEVAKQKYDIWAEHN